MVWSIFLISLRSRSRVRSSRLNSSSCVARSAGSGKLAASSFMCMTVRSTSCMSSAFHLRRMSLKCASCASLMYSSPRFGLYGSKFLKSVAADALLALGFLLAGAALAAAGFFVAVFAGMAVSIQNISVSLADAGPEATLRHQGPEKLPDYSTPIQKKLRHSPGAPMNRHRGAVPEALHAVFCRLFIYGEGF